jgi:hypothetical protein
VLRQPIEPPEAIQAGFSFLRNGRSFISTLLVLNRAGLGAFSNLKERKMAKLSESDRDKLPASKFAEPDKKAYPIEDLAHAKNAKARASQAVKAGRMSKTEGNKIDKKADTVIKKG